MTLNPVPPQHHGEPAEEAVPVSDDRIVLTIAEAARRLGIGRSSMYALVMAGEIRSVTIGRLRRIPVRCLSDYVDRLLAADSSTTDAA